MTISPGQSYPKVFPAAGRYAYVCSFHEGMTGTVRVPVRAAPTVGTTATTFVITWASVNAPTNQRYQVQRLAPGATTWATWRTTTARRSNFVTSRAGTWNFRASLQRWTGTKWVSSGWSSARRVTVTA
jgi:hypothetical protein